MEAVGIKNDLTQYWNQISRVNEPLPAEGKALEVAKRILIAARACLAYLALSILNLPSLFISDKKVEKVDLTKEQISKKLDDYVQKFININDQNVPKQSAKIFIKLGEWEKTGYRTFILNNSKISPESVERILEEFCKEKVDYSCDVFLRYQETFTYLGISKDQSGNHSIVSKDKSLDLMNIWLKSAGSKYLIGNVDDQLDENLEFKQ